MSVSSAAATRPRRRISTRLATSALASAITSTDAIANDADDQVEPHNSANCTIDLVSSSMNPAPRKKKCHDHVTAWPGCSVNANQTASADTSRTTASAAT